MAAAAMRPNSEQDELVAARTAIEAANAEIRQQVASRERLQRDLHRAQDLRDRARDQLGQVGPAEERLRAAQAASAGDRKARALAGTPGSDPALVQAIADAQRELENAQAAEEAAQAALPELEQRVREAADALAEASEAIDYAVWRRRMAEFSIELPEVRAAAAIVSDFARRIAALSDVNLRWKVYNTPHGSIPVELSDACAIPTRFSDTELREYIRLRRSAKSARLCSAEVVRTGYRVARKTSVHSDRAALASI